MRELCNDGWSIEGRPLTRDTTPIPKSSMRLRKILETVTFHQVHRYADSLVRKANHDPYELVRLYFGIEPVLPPHSLRNPGSEVPHWYKIEDGKRVNLPLRTENDPASGSIDGETMTVTF